MKVKLNSYFLIVQKIIKNATMAVIYLIFFYYLNQFYKTALLETMEKGAKLNVQSGVRILLTVITLTGRVLGVAYMATLEISVMNVSEITQ